MARTRNESPQKAAMVIPRKQNTLSQDMEEKILSMYAKGMTTGDIESHMREL